MESVEKDSLTDTLNQLVPKTLDDVVRLNREKASLRLATQAEVDALIQPIPARESVTDSISDWRFVAFVVMTGGREQRVVRLLGNSDGEGGCKITSPITALYPTTSSVTTASGSHYKLSGSAGTGEPDMYQLLHVCAYMHSIGIGAHFGVPHIFY